MLPSENIFRHGIFPYLVTLRLFLWAANRVVERSVRGLYPVQWNLRWTSRLGKGYVDRGPVGGG